MQNIWDKFWFSCEIASYGKSSISVFQEIFTSTEKFSFGEEDWELGNKSMKFGDFPDIFQFPNNLSLKALRNSWDKSYMPVDY